MVLDNRLTEFIIKGKMTVPDNAVEQGSWENFTWEYKVGDKIYRLVPCIEVEDGDKTYFLSPDEMIKQNFELCNISDASWEEVGY